MVWDVLEQRASVCVCVCVWGFVKEDVKEAYQHLPMVDMSERNGEAHSKSRIERCTEGLTETTQDEKRAKAER